MYAIPYEGEEVKLYWANRDQYYIKTSENFKDYTFKIADYSVHFRIVDATTEQNNNKESDDSKRVFMLFTEDEENFPGIKTFEHNTNEIIIRFVYDIPEDKKRKYAEENYKAASEYIFKNNSTISVWQELLSPIPIGKGKETTTLLEKHMKAYVAKNTFDYFIHKDLKGFLTRELDFYIKSEIMHLDDLDTTNEQRVETYIAKVRAIKRVGHIIIDFLAQIENFQKKLWLKKKFVIETNWCITLDRIDEEFWEEIISNKAQIQEWIDMYAVDEIKEDVCFTNPPTVEFLRQNQNLVVDTKHFSTDFKENLIASFDNIDEQIGGLMVNSENLQALYLLKNKHNHVDIIYIDPPYNTGNDDNFYYKDGYQSSSWLSMVIDRIKIGYEFLTNDGVMFVSVGDEEYEHLSVALRELFGKLNCFATLIWEKKKKGSFLSGKIANMKDYILCIAKDISDFKGLIGEIATEETTYPCVNASNTRDIRKIEYPIQSKYKERNYSLPANTIISAGNMYITLISDLIIRDGVLVPPLVIEGQWRYNQKSFEEYAQKGEIYITQDLYIRRIVKKPRYKRMKDLLLRVGEEEESNYKEIEINNLYKYGWGSNEDANDELLNVYGEQYAASYPKPTKLILKLLASARCKNEMVMDYFAGSGTTGHAIINFNRIDDGLRKYELVEMGEYFNTVAIPRLKKVVYSSDWIKGKPQNRNTGVSHIMKYMKLESYEDALSNITLDDKKHEMVSLFGDDYLINYMLDIEAEGSLLNLDEFRTPFEYKLKVTENNEIKERNVDVVETFNYLIGLTVKTVSAIIYFNVIKDDNGEYEGAVRLVKDIGGTYGFKQVEGTNPDGKRVLVIWRTISDNIIESNAALDAYFSKYRINPQDREYDIIYVNGDNNLQNISTDEDSFKVQMTEFEFKTRMFEEE